MENALGDLNACSAVKGRVDEVDIVGMLSCMDEEAS